MVHIFLQKKEHKLDGYWVYSILHLTEFVFLSLPHILFPKTWPNSLAAGGCNWPLNYFYVIYNNAKNVAKSVNLFSARINDKWDAKRATCKVLWNLAISLTLENQENFWQTRLLWLACVQPPWPIRIARSLMPSQPLRFRNYLLLPKRWLFGVL